MCLNYLDNLEIRNALVMKTEHYEYLINMINDLYNDKEIIIKPTFNEKIDEFITEIVNYNSKFIYDKFIDNRKLCNLLPKIYIYTCSSFVFCTFFLKNSILSFASLPHIAH